MHIHLKCIWVLKGVLWGFLLDSLIIKTFSLFMLHSYAGVSGFLRCPVDSSNKICALWLDLVCTPCFRWIYLAQSKARRSYGCKKMCNCFNRQCARPRQHIFKPLSAAKALLAECSFSWQQGGKSRLSPEYQNKERFLLNFLSSRQWLLPSHWANFSSRTTIACLGYYWSEAKIFHFDAIILLQQKELLSKTC